MKMPIPRKSILATYLIFFVYNCGMAIGPVNPDASPEARALLEYIQSLSGKHILSGQHNLPLAGDKNSQFAADYIGETPVIWSQDFGFSKDGDQDSYLARPAIIQEAIRQHKKGSIVTFCWHAVPPTAEEPVTFRPLPSADPAAPLASVQGRLTDKQFRDILTPGTQLHKKWIRQVDIIASFLKQLQDAHVPVLWRPYHEMNGDWFWWCGRYEGKYTTAALYRQLFDRFVKYHKLNNLLWIWSIDRPALPEREFAKYYPGDQYLDILAIDIYGNDFNQSYYDGLMALSKGKPVVLGEVGNPPALEIFDKQPNWAYWVVWAGMVRGTPLSQYEKLTGDARVLFMEDQAYIDGTRQYRTACGFEPLTINRAVDFTGEWKLNDCESDEIQSMGPVNPYKLVIVQHDNKLTVKSITLTEWAGDQVMEHTLTLDGKDIHSNAFMNSHRVQNANWTTQKDTLIIDSKVTFNFGEKPTVMISKEIWTLKKKGKKLSIFQTDDGFMNRGKRTFNLIYDKQ
jgi:mannan endo-1,4-beta-mannosidase